MSNHDHSAHARHDHGQHAHGADPSSQACAQGRPAQARSSTPARCTRRCARWARATAPSAAWRWSRCWPRPSRRKSRAAGHDAAVLDRHGAHGAGLRARDGRAPDEPQPPPRPAAVELDSAAAGNAGRALGRLAVLRARGGVGEEPQPEHVLAHRAGHGRGVALQHRRNGCAAAVPGGAAPGRRRRARSTSRPPRSSPCWCCWARCSSCARARRRPAPSRRCSGSRRRPR